MAKKGPLSLFHAPVRAWFEAAFDAPTRAQALAWPQIASGASTLVLAPTGSGKTLSAFLSAIDRLSFAPPPDAEQRLRVLYVSPLKALAVDVERNLRAPLAGIAAVATRDATPFHPIEVDVRSGDTSAAARARIARKPPDILITTPESLYLLLTSQSNAILQSVDVVIIDEIHALVPTKRGAHLALSLERLEELRKSKTPLQRIGLSATQRPLDEVARFLGGRDANGFRPVSIVDASARKDFDVRVEVPVDDLSKMGEIEEKTTSGPSASSPQNRSIWPSIHPRLVELIKAHRSTILFVNSRRLAERLAQAINELAGDEIALAHHGSVAREKRAEIEERLKRGDLPAIVATSSLELGIDMGAVDLVVQLEAPPSVASALQRIGRAGHNVGATSHGVVFPKHRGDLLPCAAIVDRMNSGVVEETFAPRNPLDVLAQQLVATIAAPPIPTGRSRKGAVPREPQPIPIDHLFDLVTRAAPFADLPRTAFENTLDMLSGRYPSDDFAELRPRVTWDRIANTVRARPAASRIAVINGGTITDRGLYGVYLQAGGESSHTPVSRSANPGGRRVGELDEEMVFESRVGDVFLLGASSWRIDEITHDRVLVTPAPGEPGKMPFWHGDRPGRPRELGQAIGALTRELGALTQKQADAQLRQRHKFDGRAAKNLVAYLSDEREATGALPTDDTIVVERFLDELGDHRVCVLSPLGARIHAPWATAVAARLREVHGVEIDSMWSDDGMAFRIPELERAPDAAQFFPAADEIENVVIESVAGTSLFAARFRECASRALLLPRRSPAKRTPLWMQRKRAADLLAVASRHRNFPVILETYREVLRDVFDLPGLVDTLRAIEQRRIRVVTTDVRRPSPMAASLLFTWVASFLYDGDAPLAERRAHALSIDTSQLRELLGEAELRELLDPDAIEEYERYLQYLSPAEGEHTRAARSADALHDMLLAIGDLSLDELRDRSEGPNEKWIAELEKERRIYSFKVGRTKRYAAAEDAARFRDAIGIVPPQGLPIAFLEKVKEPLGDLVARFARTHGPFVPASIAQRLGLAVGAIAPVLDRMTRDGKLVAGEFLRGGHGRELCDASVLRVLRRKSLARLRKEVEPVEPIALARFLPAWHRIEAHAATPRAPAQAQAAPQASAFKLLTAIEQLQGAPIPASVLERDVLPARVPGYRPSDLDALCAAGEVVWAGVEPIGATGGDGRIALHLASHHHLLAREPTRVEGELAEKIRTELAARGAIFFHDLSRAIGGYPGEALEVLWAMVWAGEITNDTMVPLRSRMREEAPARKAPRGPRMPTRLGAAPGSEGRWSLRRLSWERASETERRTALARTLLDRYGVLGRETVSAENLPGGWSSVYDVLKAMEEAGRVRRGYFVAGLGAAQFAIAGADDRLRALREGNSEALPLILASTDPANPYGAALSWPVTPNADASGTAGPVRPQRAVGSHVILYDGALVAWIGRDATSLLLFLPPDDPQRTAAARAIAQALSDLVEGGGRKTYLVAEIDGGPVPQSALAPFLREVGFIPGARGYLKKRTEANAGG